MHLFNVLSLLAIGTSALASPSPALSRRDDMPSIVMEASVNITINGAVSVRNGTGAIDTGASGFVNADGKMPRPKDREKVENERKAKGELKVGEMWRELNYKLASDKVQVRSKVPDHSDYRFVVATNGGGHARIRAFFYTRGDDNDNSFASTYMVGFARVVEVNDTYTWKNSTSFVNLISPKGSQNGKAWSAFSAGMIDMRGSAVFTANTTFMDPKGSGFAFTLSTFLSQNNAQIAGANGTFKPNAIKYSIGMVGFPFKYTNSHLVIVKTIWSKEGLPDVNSNHTVTLGKGTGNQFSWDSTASIKTKSNSSETQVKIDVETALQNPANDDLSATQPDGSNESDAAERPFLAFYHIRVNNLTNASAIMWDPELGVASDTEISGMSGTGSGSGASKVSGVMGCLLGLAVAFMVIL